MSLTFSLLLAGILGAAPAAPQDAAPWVVVGELVRVDPAAARGVFRHEGTDAAVRFEIRDPVLLDRLGGPGPLPDYAPGDRLIFELARGPAPGEFRLIALREEAAEMAARDECLHLELIDTRRWPRWKCTHARRDQTAVFDSEYWLEIAPTTRFWRSGQPATPDDVQPGDCLLARTRGVGAGRVRVAVDVYLDRESWEQAR